MGAWLRRQRHWLVVEPLPGYAPELNPVEALWSHLKGVELANLAGETLEEVITAAERGVQRIRGTHPCPTRSFGTAACRCGDLLLEGAGLAFPHSWVLVGVPGGVQCVAMCRRPASRKARPAAAQAANVQAAAVPPAPSK